jgi:hypothetical protein
VKRPRIPLIDIENGEEDEESIFVPVKKRLSEPILRSANFSMSPLDRASFNLSSVWPYDLFNFYSDSSKWSDSYVEQ